MIVVLDDVITIEQAVYCIDKFKQGVPAFEEHGKIIIDNEQFLLKDDLFVDILNNIMYHACKISPGIVKEWSHLTQWKTLSHHGLHHDDLSDQTVFTSITYLSSAYRGGETFFEDGTIISPVVGRTVFFDGKKYKHGVRSIANGIRYSLPIWYKKKDL